MNKKSGFLTFITALIPGVGYMYYGLQRRGVETFVLFLLISPVLRALGLNVLSPIISIPFWFYTFFDTYSIAHKYEAGEILEDISLFNKNNELGRRILANDKFKKDKWIILAWILILLGTFAILNKIFYLSIFFSNIRVYLVPVLFILSGVYILTKKN